MGERFVEERFTLREARRKLDLLQCERDGHDIDVHYGGSLAAPNEPRRLLCERCGRLWTVTPYPDLAAQPAPSGAAAEDGA